MGCSGGRRKVDHLKIAARSKSEQGIRFFFGLGAETSIVVVSKILIKWFRGKDLALAFGLKVGFGRLGTFAALQLSPIIADGGQYLSNATSYA